MIAEAIDKIQQLTRNEARIEWAPDYPETGRYFVWPSDGGEPDERFKIVPPRTVRHYSTGSLAQHVTSDVTEHDANLPEAYIDARQVRVALTRTDGDNDYDVRWAHTLTLTKHPAYLAVEALTRTTTFTQRELIRYLRAQLNGHVDDAVVEQFRNLKLTTDGDSNSVIAKGRESVDKRIQQQVRQGTGTDIPDEIIVTIPVHDLDETRHELHEVTILVDTTTGDDGGVQFELTTVLNTLRASERAALDGIRSNLRDALPDSVDIYHATIE